MKASLAAFLLTCHALGFAADRLETLFHEEFKETLDPQWTWVREERGSWRVRNHALHVKVEPGNMWGPQNDARNVLVRPLPKSLEGDLILSAIIENKPTHQYEQVDLVWYYDDKNMVKLGQELVDGKLSVVMGREEKDKTRTIGIHPLSSSKVRLRFIVSGRQIRGQFQDDDAQQWKDAGECDLPREPATANLSLQFYQGPPDQEHWARVYEVRIERSARLGR